MSVLIFVMLRLVPGNMPSSWSMRPASADSKEKAKIIHELGLDRPIIEQYGQWIGGLSRGDLGFAYVSERPAIEEIAPRIPISAKLAGMACLLPSLSACRSASSARCGRTRRSTISCACSVSAAFRYPRSGSAC